MSLKNRYNLWKLKQDFVPSKVFKAGLWRNLNSAWNSQYGRPSWFQLGLLHKGAAVAVMAAFLIGSTGAYAYVSPEVTEGTMFYPLKQAVESAEEATKITPEAKAKFYLKQIKRRESEKARLVRKNPVEIRIKKTEQSIERLQIRLERQKQRVEERITKQKARIKKFEELKGEKGR